MSDSLDAFFTLTGTTDLPEAQPRDQWGRPLILQEDGSRKAYTRASSLSGMIENRTGLHIWDNKNIARGLAVRPDLVAMVASLPSPTGDKRKDAVTNASFNEYLEMAREAAQAHDAANWGTSIHGFTEPGMRGNPAVPERIQGDVDSYWGRIDEYHAVCVASEVFVVNDELGVAGTLDDVYWLPGFGVVVGDKKSGKKKPHSVLIQMAVYANSFVYDIETGRRSPLISLVDWKALGFEGPAVSHHNLDWAMFVHVPLGEGETTFYKADIRLGYEMAVVAAKVRDYQRQQEGLVWDAHNEILAGVRVQQAAQLISAATTREEMVSIANSFQDVWNERLTQHGRDVLAAQARA